MIKENLKVINLAELQEFVEELGEKKYIRGNVVGS
jgi:hypothetical protein